MNIVSQFFKVLIIPVKTICPANEGTSLASRLDCFDIARLLVYSLSSVPSFEWT